MHLAACLVMKCDGTGECADEIGNYFNLATTVVAASSGGVAQCVHGYFICCATDEMLRFLLTSPVHMVNFIVIIFSTLLLLIAMMELMSLLMAISSD